MILRVVGGGVSEWSIEGRNSLYFLHNAWWNIWSTSCNHFIISNKIHCSYLKKLIIVLLHLHVTDGTYRWRSGTSGQCIKYKLSKFSSEGLILTSQPISRLGTILRVPVNVQEGNRLKKHAYKTINFEFKENLSWKEEYLPQWTIASNSSNLTWLNVGLLCNLEQRSPCLQAPILK